MLALIEEAFARSHARVLYSTTGDAKGMTPVYLGVETEAGERYGVLCYPFRANKHLIRNRPSDEHRLQIRYGSERTWHLRHPLGRDVAGVDVTLVLGVHVDAGLFIGLDPIAYDPLPMGISIEFKDEHVAATQKAGWHVWERVNRPGTRRRAARTSEGLETIIAFTPGRLLDYVRLERQASSLGLDPPLRFRLAERIGDQAGQPQPTHALERQFDLSATELLDIIARRFRLGVALRGGVAEYHLERFLAQASNVRAVHQIDQDGEPDLDVEFGSGTQVRVECKNVSPRRYADGTIKIEVQKTRSQRGDPAGRLYRPEQFDIVAACLFSVSGIWEFRFKRSTELTRSPDFPDRIAPIQRVDETWAESLEQALGST